MDSVGHESTEIGDTDPASSKGLLNAETTSTTSHIISASIVRASLAGSSKATRAMQACVIRVPAGRAAHPCQCRNDQRRRSYSSIVESGRKFYRGLPQEPLRLVVFQF